MSEQDQERTEEPTQKKREDARDKGQVAMSQDLVAALSLGAAGGVLVLAGSMLAQGAGALIRSSAANLASVGPAEVSIEAWSGVVSASAVSMALPLAGVIVPMLAIGLFAGYAQ